MRVVGIGGWDRSGSTILAGVLGSATGLVNVGELNNLWQRGVVENSRCACGVVFSDCLLWGPVMSLAFSDDEGQRILRQAMEVARSASNHRMLFHRAFRLLDAERAVYVQALSRLVAAAGTVSGSRVLVDASKTPWHLEAMSEASTEFVMVHLVRDPRGVVFSHRKKIAYDPDHEPGRPMATRGAFFTTAGWMYRNLSLSLLGRSHAKWVRVSYDCFTASPRDVASLILDGVGADVATIEFTGPDRVRIGTSHSISGNPVRFRTGETEIKRDSDWLSGMSGVERKAIGLATWPMRGIYRLRGSLRSRGIENE